MTRAGIALVLLAVACRQEPRRIEIDLARFEAAADEHGDQAMASAKVEACFDGLLDRIGDLDLVPGLGKLKDRIEGDAPLTVSVESFLAELAESDAFHAKIAEVARQNPNDTDDELATRIEKLADSAIDGPAFDKALNRGVDRLLEHPDLIRQFRRLDDTADGAVRDAMRSPSLERVLAKQLTIWNDGEIPGRERATDLLIERVATVERLTELYAGVLDLPVVEHQSSRAVALLSEKKAFGDLALRRLRTLADDAELRRRMRVIFEVLLTDPDDAPAIEAAVVRALETPSVARELAAFLDDVIASPELSAIGGEAMRNIAADAEFKRLIEAFLLGERLAPPPGTPGAPSRH
jgi:hypothetical protein